MVSVGFRHKIKESLCQIVAQGNFFCGWSSERADECGVPMALNTIVAFDMSNALVMDEDKAYGLCEELNRDKESLVSTGYTMFEAVPFEEQQYK